MKNNLILALIIFSLKNVSSQVCIDPNLIDPTTICPAVVNEVCGCDGVTYSNSCEAMKKGNTEFTNGPCVNFIKTERNSNNYSNLSSGKLTFSGSTSLLTSVELFKAGVDPVTNLGILELSDGLSNSLQFTPFGFRFNSNNSYSANFDFLDEKITLDGADGDALVILNSGDEGIVIDESGDKGLFIDDSGGDGLFISDSGQRGIEILRSTQDGLYVSGSGLGYYSLNVEGSKNGSNPPELIRHIAKIENETNSPFSNVLAIKTGVSSPGNAVSYVSFFDGNDGLRGKIIGNSVGGVAYVTSGADFAERLELIDLSEDIENGDVVGIKNGKITRNTKGAHHVTVVTDRPAIIGNYDEQKDLTSKDVSFIGQVPVKVLGKVENGDWIIASGNNDGFAKAVAPRDIEIDHQIIGRAWESSESIAVKKVNVAIGLDVSSSKDQIIENLSLKLNWNSIQLKELKTELLKIKEQLDKK